MTFFGGALTPALKVAEDALSRLRPLRSHPLSLPYRLRYVSAWDQALSRAVLGVSSGREPGQASAVQAEDH